MTNNKTIVFLLTIVITTVLTISAERCFDGSGAEISCKEDRRYPVGKAGYRSGRILLPKGSRGNLGEDVKVGQYQYDLIEQQREINMEDNPRNNPGFNSSNYPDGYYDSDHHMNKQKTNKGMEKPLSTKY